MNPLNMMSPMGQRPGGSLGFPTMRPTQTPPIMAPGAMPAAAPAANPGVVPAAAGGSPVPAPAAPAPVPQNVPVSVVTAGAGAPTPTGVMPTNPAAAAPGLADFLNGHGMHGHQRMHGQHPGQSLTGLLDALRARMPSLNGGQQ